MKKSHKYIGQKILRMTEKLCKFCIQGDSLIAKTASFDENMKKICYRHGPETVSFREKFNIYLKFHSTANSVSFNNKLTTFMIVLMKNKTIYLKT